MSYSEDEKKGNYADIINLKEVGYRIGKKDKETIKNWLISNNVTIHYMTKLIFVYKVELDCALILPQVKDYRKRYPAQWESFFKRTIEDGTLFNLIMLRLELDIKYVPTTKVKRNKNDEELYKKLLS